MLASRAAGPVVAGLLVLAAASPAFGQDDPSQMPVNGREVFLSGSFLYTSINNGGLAGVSYRQALGDLVAVTAGVEVGTLLAKLMIIEGVSGGPALPLTTARGHVSFCLTTPIYAGVGVGYTQIGSAYLYAVSPSLQGLAIEPLFGMRGRLDRVTWGVEGRVNPGGAYAASAHLGLAL